MPDCIAPKDWADAPERVAIGIAVGNQAWI